MVLPNVPMFRGIYSDHFIQYRENREIEINRNRGRSERDEGMGGEIEREKKESD